MMYERIKISSDWKKSSFGAVLLLAAIATIGTFFGLSAPSQVVVVNTQEKASPSVQPDLQPSVQPTSEPSVQPDSEKYIAQASGIGITPLDATSDAERRQAALRAAHIVARRNLIAYAQGADIEAVTVVDNGILERDEIRETVKGRLAQAEMIFETYDAALGQAHVTLGIRLSTSK